MAKNYSYYIDGKFVKSTDAIISVMDTGFQRGYGIFDVFRVYEGKPFRLKDHLIRALNSAKLAKMKLPFDYARLERSVLRTITKNRLKNAIVKIVISGGENKDMMLLADKVRLIILVKDFSPPQERSYKLGAKVITFKAERFMPQIKSTNYLPAVMGHIEAKRARATEALYTNNGNILEGALSNFFIVKRGLLITPGKDVLSGITRKAVLELAPKIMKLKIANIKIKDALEADEAFITSTTKEIMPVTHIDNKKIGNGKPGQYTKKLMELFNKITK